MIDVPRPFVDPITSLVEALSVIALALQRPMRASTVVLAVDHHMRGIHLFRTTSLSREAFHHIITQSSCVHNSHGVVIASTRTGPPVVSSDAELLRCGQFMLSAAGLRLIDWIVLGAGGLYCPRSLYGLPEPWPYGSTFV